MLLLTGCSYHLIDFSKDISDLKNLRKKSIIDLSKKLEFDLRTNNLVIHDSVYLNKLTDILKIKRLSSLLLIHSKHKDRFYHETQFTNILKLRDHFIANGIDREKIKAKIGLDFGIKYSPILENSTIILIVK